MTTPFLGSIMLFAGNFTPRGYFPCDGALRPISENTMLFSLIGTAYGGDGVNTFAMPDLRGRVMLGRGQGSGLTNRVIGESDGVETVTLTTANLPAHSHTVIATTVDGTTTSPANTLPAAPSLNVSFLYLNPAATGTTTVAPAPTAIGTAGGNQAHSNVMPTLALTYVIAAEGIFPQPS